MEKTQVSLPYFTQKLMPIAASKIHPAFPAVLQDNVSL